MHRLKDVTSKFLNCACDLTLAVTGSPSFFRATPLPKQPFVKRSTGLCTMCMERLRLNPLNFHTVVRALQSSPAPTRYQDERTKLAALFRLCRRGVVQQPG